MTHRGRKGQWHESRHGMLAEDLRQWLALLAEGELPPWISREILMEGLASISVLSLDQRIMACCWLAKYAWREKDIYWLPTGLPDWPRFHSTVQRMCMDYREQCNNAAAVLRGRLNPDPPYVWHVLAVWNTDFVDSFPLPR